MALKYKLAKKDYDKLSDDLKGEYLEENGSYVLDIDGLPAPEGGPELKRAKDREKQRADEAEAEVDRLSTDLENIKKNQGKGEKDIERLTKRHEKELNDVRAEADEKVGKLTKFIDKEVKAKHAEAIATKISTAPKLMAKEIVGRIAIDYDADEPSIVYLGADGKPDTKLDPEKLSAEYIANKEFSAIIIGSKARGSGTPPDNIPGSGGRATPGDDGKPVDLASAPNDALLAHVRSKVANNAANNGS
jgi:ElaB/YqjD/DUF883 family membrane-anchored ribosome-binding protein